jgi:hypothetical protein
MMQSVEEHQEILKQDAAVMLIGGLRKRRSICNLAAKCSQKMKERTHRYWGFRRKLAAACRKVFHHVKVAWRERKLVRKIRTQGNWDRGRNWASHSCREINHRSEVARQGT